MAVTISVSDSPSDIWMVQNAIFAVFCNFIIERNKNDSEVVSTVETAAAFGGVSLDVVFNDQPALAIRLSEAFLAVADEVGCGSVTLSGVVADHAVIRSKFAELSLLLRRFLQSGRSGSA